MGTSRGATRRRVGSWAAVLLLLLVLLPGRPGSAQGLGPRLADPNTTFHRFYVEGAGTASEESSWNEDLGEVRGDLETSDNQASGSTSDGLDEPTKQQLQDAIDRLQDDAQPGQEVTLFFSGHGGTEGLGDADADETDGRDEFFWLNDANGDGQADADEVVSDDELADWLQGFRQSVTLVVIFDSCFGGGFTGGSQDIQETDHVAVVGVATTCPTDTGWTVETLSEAIADKAGEGEADANGDGIVTAQELKIALGNQSATTFGPNWQVGPPESLPEAQRKPKFGKSKCAPRGCPLPPPSMTTSARSAVPGGEVLVGGTGFSAGSSVYVKLLAEDGTPRLLLTTTADPLGSFQAQVQIPDVAQGNYALFALDADLNQDWKPLGVGTRTCGGEPVTLWGSEGDDGIAGTWGRDVVHALGGDDTVETGPGRDLICLGGGIDETRAGGGDDVAFGEAGPDRLFGEGGDDRLTGGRGEDLLDGGRGRDNCAPDPRDRLVRCEA